jgi:hypothetical protein
VPTVVDEIITKAGSISFTSIVFVLVTVVVSSAVAGIVLVAESVAPSVPVIPKVTESPLKVVDMWVLDVDLTTLPRS